MDCLLQHIQTRSKVASGSRNAIFVASKILQKRAIIIIIRNSYFNIFPSIIESQPGTPSKTAKKEAELEASEFKLQKTTEVYSEQNSAETQSNGTAKEAAPAQRNISCLSDANTAAGSAQREVVVSTGRCNYGVDIYEGIPENPAIQIFFIHFFIDNSNAKYQFAYFKLS